MALVVFLHGFLGGGADWKKVVEALPGDRFQCHFPDYTTDEFLKPEGALLTGWGRAFGRWMKDRRLPPEETLLVGYSQGGRLALHALADSGLPLRGAVLLSAHPGLSEEDSEARQARARNDETWARRFQEEPWEMTLTEWNRQGVFSGSGVEPSRTESPGARARAAASLRSWSLSGQRDFRDFLRRHPRKTYWMMGEKDPKFVALWDELRADVPGVRGEVVPGAGHRIPFDAPGRLAERLSSVFEMQF